MTIVVWRILCLASMALFVAGLFALLFTRLLKNRYYRDFCPDELMRETETANSKNSIYFTSGETKKYIKKYALCKTAYDKYLVCNFAKSFRSIRYFVVEYTKRKRVLAVQQATEYSTGDASKIIFPAQPLRKRERRRRGGRRVGDQSSRDPSAYAHENPALRVFKEFYAVSVSVCGAPYRRRTHSRQRREVFSCRSHELYRAGRKFCVLPARLFCDGRLFPPQKHESMQRRVARI